MVIIPIPLCPKEGTEVKGETGQRSKDEGQDSDRDAAEVEVEEEGDGD